MKFRRQAAPDVFSRHAGAFSQSPRGRTRIGSCCSGRVGGPNEWSCRVSGPRGFGFLRLLIHTVLGHESSQADIRLMVHVRRRGRADQPGRWELASWMCQGHVRARMSRGRPTELARTIYGRRDALGKKADFPAGVKG